LASEIDVIGRDPLASRGHFGALPPAKDDPLVGLDFV